MTIRDTISKLSAVDRSMVIAGLYDAGALVPSDEVAALHNPDDALIAHDVHARQIAELDGGAELTIEPDPSGHIDPSALGLED